MSIWQFKINAYPCEFVIEQWGHVPSNIGWDVATIDGKSSELNCEPDDFNPWQGRDYGSTCSEVVGVLPQACTWSEDAMMFGAKGKNWVEVWQDSLHVRIDCRSTDETLIRSLADLFQRLDVVVANQENGSVIENTTEALVEAIQGSLALQFVQDPGATLEERVAKN